MTSAGLSSQWWPKSAARDPNLHWTPVGLRAADPLLPADHNLSLLEFEGLLLDRYALSTVKHKITYEVSGGTVSLQFSTDMDQQGHTLHVPADP